MFNPSVPLDTAGVEIAPGIFVPANRVGEFDSFTSFVDEMHTCTVEVAPGILVERQNIVTWIHRMENDPVFVTAMDCLMDRLNTDSLSDTTITLNLTPTAAKLLRRRHSVADFALNFASDKVL